MSSPGVLLMGAVEEALKDVPYPYWLGALFLLVRYRVVFFVIFVRMRQVTPAPDQAAVEVHRLLPSRRPARRRVRVRG